MKPVKRIGINVGGGYVAGINAVIAGTVLAGHELGWEVMGIRDGFDGLLFPERYPDSGLLKLTPQMVENLTADGGAILGNATRTDPFRVRQVNAENMVEEVDRSGDLIARIAAEKIDAVISVVGPRALSILFRLHRQGLRTVCVPTSVENDVAATQLSFGFNSALSFAVDMIERVRQAAQSARQDWCGRGPGRARRVAGPASRHRRVCRCGADPGDSLRPAESGREAQGEDQRGTDLRPGGGGRGRLAARRSSNPRQRRLRLIHSKPRFRPGPRAREVRTSSRAPAVRLRRWLSNFSG